MRHALADLEGEGGGVTWVAIPFKIQKWKKSDKAKQKTEEMKKEKEKKESVERFF